jgi:hypothetical protein
VHSFEPSLVVSPEPVGCVTLFAILDGLEPWLALDYEAPGVFAVLTGHDLSLLLGLVDDPT